MTFGEKLGGVSTITDDNNGVALADDFTKVANLTNNISQFKLPLSLTSSSAKISKSKVIKKHAIHLIRFCLKSGISENKSIIKFLEENEIFLPGRTFDRYKNLAERELETDLDADIWLSEKTQNALIHDYKDISDRYDRQLAIDDMLMESLFKQAADKATKFESDPGKYYRYLDFTEMLKVQAISNYTMKNKLELISKGFMVYKIKRHIESLREQLSHKELTRERDIDICSKLSFLQKSNPNSDLGTKESQQVNNELPNEEYSKEYLDENNLVIGMNGRPIKKYLAEIEKKLGKPLSTI
jgi:hypothetical protein